MAIHFSPDEGHLFVSNAGDNSIAIYKRDMETGMLKMLSTLPISGDYPKDFAIFPDGLGADSISALNTSTKRIFPVTLSNL